MRGVPGWQLNRCIVTTLLRGAESIRMIYRARAGTFFCIFFVFLARVSSGVRSMLWGSRIILPKTKQKIKILNWASQGIVSTFSTRCVQSIFIVFSRPFFSKPDQQARFLVCRPPSFSLCLLDKNLFPNK